MTADDYDRRRREEREATQRQRREEAQRAIDGAIRNGNAECRQRAETLRSHMERQGISPELVAIRLLQEVSNAQPPAAAWRSIQADEATARREALVRKLRERERGRDERGRGERER